MPKHKRHKLDHSIIDFDEIGDFPALQGLKETIRQFGSVPETAFNSKPNTPQAEAASNAPKRGTPAWGTTVQGPLVQGTTAKGSLGSPSQDYSERDAPHDRDICMQGGTALIQQPVTDLTALAALGLCPDPPALKPATLAQHAHTQNEELLYGKMWGKGSPLPGQPCRILTAGIKKLAALIGLSKPDNCRNNLQGLIEKLAIDDLGVAPNPNLGHVYRIWDQSAILQRRRERGLTHYYRLRRAVYLVNPETVTTGVPLCGVPYASVPQSGGPHQSDPAIENREPQTGVPLWQNRVPSNRQNRVPQNRPLPIRNRNSEEDDGQEVARTVVDALLSVMGECDDDSARRIVSAARAVRPDIPDQVIVQIIHMKGPRIRWNRSLDYPLRVLELAVAETAQGVTGANLCKAQARASLSQMGIGGGEVQAQVPVEEMQAMLNDPKTPESMREFIRAKMDGG